MKGIFIPVVFLVFFLILNPAIALADITTGLAGYWKFDEGGGTIAADSSGNGNNGTLMNGPAWTTGRVGQALNFDGSNDVVNMGDQAGLSGFSAITISAWIRPQLTGDTSQRIVDKGGQAGAFSFFVVPITGVLGMSMVTTGTGGGTSNLYSGEFGLTAVAGQWQHVVMTWDSATAKINVYLNGNPGTAQNRGGDNLASGTGWNFKIGDRDGGDRSFYGQVDEVRVYNRALNAGDVLELYNSAGAPPPPDTTPPSPPANLTATAISYHQVNLSWTAATDNVGVTGYRIYREDSEIGTSTTTSYLDATALPSTTYTYTVSAYDGDGNEGSRSSPASATTPAAPTGNIYYVSKTSCSDSGPGSQSQPWCTIQKAANTMAAGDTVMVLAGNYSTERVSVTRSGSPGAKITYQADGNVTMKGFYITANYIIVRGFEISNKLQSWPDNIGIYVRGSNNEILDNYLHDLIGEGAIYLYGGSSRDAASTNNNLVSGNRIYRARMAGIYVEGVNSIVEDNEISHTLQNPPNSPSISGADADGIRFFGSGHIIRKNYIHDITLADPENDNSPHIDCFQTWGPASNIIFEQNFCTNMNDNMQGWMIEDVGAQVSNFTIRNNIIRAFRIANVWGAPNTEIFQNTFRSELNYTGTSGYGIEFHDCPNSKLQNNIFFDVGRHQYHYYVIAGDSSGISVKNNLIYMSDDINPAGSPASGDLWQVNPNFTGQAANDYHLSSDSPAIDAGLDLSSLVANDYESNPRPVDGDNNGSAEFDIGAYEYVSSQPPQPIPGDLDDDGDVDIDDLIIVTRDFGRTSGYDARADTIINEEIDIYDVVFVASRFT